MSARVYFRGVSALEAVLLAHVAYLDARGREARREAKARRLRLEGALSWDELWEADALERALTRQRGAALRGELALAPAPARALPLAPPRPCRPPVARPAQAEWVAA